MWISKHKLTKKWRCWVKLRKYQIISTNKNPFCSSQQDLILKLKKWQAKDLLEFNFHICSTLSWRSCPHTEFALTLSQTQSLKWDRYHLVLQDCAGFISAMGAVWGFRFTYSNLHWNYREDLECNKDFLYPKTTLSSTYVFINPVLPPS